MQQAFIDEFQIHSSTHNPNGIYLAVGVHGIDFPEVRYSGIDRAGRSGHLPRSSRYGGRRLTWNGFIEAEDVATFNVMRRQLLSVIASLTNYDGTPLTKRLSFTTDDGLDLFTDVLLAGKPELPDENMLHAEFQIPFFSPEPQLFSPTKVSLSTTRPTGSGFIMPTLVPILMGEVSGGSVIANNAGTTFSWPIITLSGVHTNPIMRNDLTGQFMQLNLTTSSSDEVVIDMNHDSIILNGSQALIDVPTNDSTYWWLDPGPNPISFSSGATTDDGTMTLEFYPAYVGA